MSSKQTRPLSWGCESSVGRAVHLSWVRIPIKVGFFFFSSILAAFAFYIRSSFQNCYCWTSITNKECYHCVEQAQGYVNNANLFRCVSTENPRGLRHNPPPPPPTTTTTTPIATRWGYESACTFNATNKLDKEIVFEILEEFVESILDLYLTVFMSSIPKPFNIQSTYHNARFH